MGRFFALPVLLLWIPLTATDLTGIWTGQVAGRNNEKEDVSIQFQMKAGKLTGTVFGDEFDLSVEEGTVDGDQIRFVVTAKNYYNGSETKLEYTGTIKGSEMELKRSRMGGPPPNPNDANRRPRSQTFTLKRLI